MSNTYSTCVLGPEFSIIDIELNPGRPFSVEKSNVQLAGGFPELFPASSCILSPTLQLNKDLGGFSEGALEQIARAELARHNRVEVRNYTVDPSFMVCVIAAEHGRLEDFLDTYGGILEIEPILVTAEHPDYPQVTEIEISADTGSYRVTTTVRSPLNRSGCTYCGACGPACPEQCISPSLRIDYRKCTFCRECEAICPVDAIDIYGVERKELITPAVILLGDMNLELPEDSRHIYLESNLPDYLKTLCSLEVEEAVQCDNEICQYSPKLDSGCSLCVEACRYGAISRGRDGVRVDSLACTECGRCCSVCPTGAMQHKRFSDAAFFEYFKDVDLTETADVVIGTEAVLHELWWEGKAGGSSAWFFLEHSCPDALSLFHYLYLFSRGANRITILRARDNQATTGLDRDVAAVNEFLAAVSGIVEPVRVKTTEQFVADPGTMEAEPAVMQLNETFLNRRAALAEMLAGFFRRYGKEISLGSTLGGFGTVLCREDRCTHCYACLNECKIGALQASEDSRSLLYTSSLCVGCNACAEICPEDALQVGRETLLGPAFTEAVELARAEPMLCKGCGKDFGTRKSFEKVMRILANKDMGDKGHLEYCDTCRVVKLFEASESNEQ